ncbi:hypothetical protein L6R52_26105 [Myxococcota bacterium]|nr:hypothetical protein [Myxococcota bacterium]
MAKTGRGRDKATGPAKSGDADALADATAAFARGDYGRARVLLAAKIGDASLSEGQREEARELLAATGFERGTLWVGLGCIGLLILVLIVTAALQP